MKRLAPWLVSFCVACGTAPPPERPPDPRATPPAPTPAPFVEVGPESGFTFVHENGNRGRLEFAEMMGPGAAMLDYDDDGDLDLWLVQGGALDPGAARPSDRLFRNEWNEGRGLRFTDVTEDLGLAAGGYGMGVATGDFDGDGWIDVYLTSFGPNLLLRNVRGAGFEDVTDHAGVGDDRFSIPAVFFDYDRDGRLDLWVGNYVDYRVGDGRRCRTGGREEYCGPLTYAPEPDRLFRSAGNGRFEDVSTAAGIRAVTRDALGVSVLDHDGDGRLDLYVANDAMENTLWVNREDGFTDESLIAGCAVNASGQPESSMGVALADVDGDGDEDLFLTHMDRETHTLYRNDGRGWFRDDTVSSGIPVEAGYTGFGVAWADLDRDGRLDLVIANGAVELVEEQWEAEEPNPLRHPNQIYLARDEGYVPVHDFPGGRGDARVTRGLAVGDVDNDGDPDLLFANNGGAARLVLSRLGDGRHWVGVRAVTGTPGRDALGARVRLLLPGNRSVFARVETGGSYASARDPRVLFGLGDEKEILAIEITWVDGAVERFARPAPDRYHTLRQGEGAPP